MSESNSVYRHHEQELDLFRDATPSGLSRVGVTLVIAALTAWMLNADALANWAFELPFWLGPVREGAMGVAAAGVWLSEALALDHFYDAVRSIRDALQSLSF